MRSLERTVLALLVSSALTTTGVGCSGTGGDPPTRATHTTAFRGMTSTAEGHPFLKSDGDGDHDDHSKATSSDDEGELLVAKRYGATTTEHTAMKTVLERYYAAASARDGASGCALLTRELASSLAPSRASGQTCAQALSRLFAVQSSHLAAEHADTMVLTGVHAHAGVALVTLGFRSAPEAELILRREDGNWKLNALFDSGLP